MAYPTPEELDLMVARAMCDRFDENTAVALRGREAREQIMLDLFHTAMGKIQSLMRELGPPPGAQHMNGRAGPTINH